MKKIALHSKQFFLTENVNLDHRETHHLNKNRYYVANKFEKSASNYAV